MIDVEGVPPTRVFLHVLKTKRVAAKGCVSVENTGLQAVQNEHLQDSVSAENRGFTARELGSISEQWARLGGQASDLSGARASALRRNCGTRDSDEGKGHAAGGNGLGRLFLWPERGTARTPNANIKHYTMRVNGSIYLEVLGQVPIIPAGSARRVMVVIHRRHGWDCNIGYRCCESNTCCALDQALLLAQN
jgi:hypothetical protein